MAFKDYHTTPSSNVSLANTSLQEGQTRLKDLNDQIRQIMADLKDAAPMQRTLAELRALSFSAGTIPDIVVVDTLGLFRYDSADTTTADDGATVIVTTDGKRFKIFGYDLKAPLASPAFTGTPTAPTAAPGTNTTQLATTAFVEAEAVSLEASIALKAPLASPSLTGTPTAPTAAAGTSTTQIATTAYAKAADDLKQNLSEKSQPSGYASLDAGGKVPVGELPDAVLGTVQFQATWNATTNTPTIPAASSANKGHYYRVATAGTTLIDGINDWGLGDWIVSNGTVWQKIDNSEAVTSVAGKTGAVSLVKADVGLGNVDNTSDASKPVSTAQQTALDAKVTGPASAVADNLAVFDGTTGKLIKDGGSIANYLAPSAGTPTTDRAGAALSGDELYYDSTAARWERYWPEQGQFVPLSDWITERNDETLLTAGATTFTISASGTTITLSSGTWNSLGFDEHQNITVGGTGTASDGRIMRVVSQSGSTMTLAAMNGGPVFVDGGPYSTGQTVKHARFRSSLFWDNGSSLTVPKFRMSDYYARAKLELFSVIFEDVGDTSEAAFLVSDGTQSARTIRTAPYPGAYIYGVAWDGVNPFGSGAHSKRHAQISFPITETPSPTAHGGALSFAVAREGTITPIERLWLAPDGGVWFPFRGTAEDNPAFDTNAEIDAYTPSGAGDRINTPSGYHSWMMDKVSFANLNLIQSNDTTFAAIAIRKPNDKTNGYDVGLINADNEYVEWRVQSGVRLKTRTVSLSTGIHALGHDGAGGSPALRAIPAASGVNYVEITGSANTDPLLISAAGSDANISLRLVPKGSGAVFVYSAEAGATGPALLLDHASPSPAVGDRTDLIFRGRDSLGNITDFAQISCLLRDVTDGATEAGALRFFTRTDNALHAVDFRVKKVTIADDAATSIQLPAASFGIVDIIASQRDWSSRYAWDTTTDNSEFMTASTTKTAFFAYGTGALTGLTGVDGNITVRVHTDDKLYIENRAGGALTFTVLIFEGV